jgi:cyclase
MLAKRIIPCLDVKNGRVVKGTNFVNLRDMGDPVECAMAYDKQGADEIVFLDITATHEGRATLLMWLKKTAEKVFVPLTVGGGISSPDAIQVLLRAGADKVSLNSAAVVDPSIIKTIIGKIWKSMYCVAIDARRNSAGDFSVVINGGRIDTGIDARDWAVRASCSGQVKFC